MSLESFFVFDDDPLVNSVQTLSEKIKQRRTQMLIHSYLYYEKDSPVISDEKWQEWADELVELHTRMKDIDFYDDVFADWTGATGMHLPFDPWVIKRAECVKTNEWRELHKKVLDL